MQPIQLAIDQTLASYIANTSNFITFVGILVWYGSYWTTCVALSCYFNTTTTFGFYINDMQVLVALYF